MYHLYSTRDYGPWQWDPDWPEELTKWQPIELSIMLQIDEWVNERHNEEYDKVHAEQEARQNRPSFPH